MSTVTPSLLEELVELEKKATPVKWEFYWRVDDDKHADCGIFSEQRKGHAISVCRAPRYEKRQQWEANAALISALRNAFPAIVSALADRDRARKGALNAERYEWIRANPGEYSVLMRKTLAHHTMSEDEINRLHDEAVDSARSLIAPPAEKEKISG